MDFKTKSLIAMLIVSVFLLSSCEVYQTLYGGTNVTGQVVAPPEEKMEEKPVEQVVNVTMEEKKEEEVVAPVVEKPKGKPIVLVVQETDLVSLLPKAEDPDKDILAFTFTSPIDERGEWQTNYGDAGEYTVTVTVSDSKATDSRDVLIIVNKKEEAPTIDNVKPIESGLTIDETQALEFSVKASDLNNDPLTYTWKLDGNDVGNNADYTYQTDYDSAGTHTVKIDVTDGMSTTSRIWSVQVRNVNRKPALEKIEDIDTKETDKIVITALATDDDKDTLTYAIDDKKFTQSDNVFTWETDYDSAGTYEVTVSVSDGQDTTEQLVNINVENVNRPPVIVDVQQQQQ